MKDEFSINELEPERNTVDNTSLDNPSNNANTSDATLLNQEAANLEEKKKEEAVEDTILKEEYEGPTLKEVIANSVNPDYQGPTAKEIVVNSVKVDNTKKKNYVGLFVLILVLVLVGFIAGLEILSDDNKKKSVDYLKDMPEWVEKYNEYFQEEYKDIVAYNVSFLDLDFDDKPEAIVNYLKENKTIYEVVDAIDNLYVNVGELSDILMMYSFEDEDVTWYINTSLNDNDLNLVNLKKRLNSQSDYETYLTLDDLSKFKSEHFTLSYNIKYTKISFRTVEQNLVEAVKVYETEKNNVDNIVTSTINKYSSNL